MQLNLCESKHDSFGTWNKFRKVRMVCAVLKKRVAEFRMLPIISYFRICRNLLITRYMHFVHIEYSIHLGLVEFTTTR